MRNRAKEFAAYVRKSSHATQELRNLQKQHVLKDTPEGDNPITDPKIDETEGNKGEAEGWVIPKWPTLEKGVGAEGSGGYKLELLVLHD